MVNLLEIGILVSKVNHGYYLHLLHLLRVGAWDGLKDSWERR